MKKINLLLLSLLLSLSGAAVLANQTSANNDNKAKLKNVNQLEQEAKSKDTKAVRNSKTDKKDKNIKEPKPPKNSKKNQSNKTNTSKSNLDAYPKKLLGRYASMNTKNGCASFALMYKKTKQWPGLQITKQQVSHTAEKLVCKPQKIKAMDGNFYVAESCKIDNRANLSRHLIYAKNNDLLAISSDNKLQTYTECDLPRGVK
jgi:hypothetical protein